MTNFSSNWRGKLLQKRYCLHDLIAEGRYSRVFLAIDLASDHQKCVVKELVHDFYPVDVKQTMELMFQQEAKILRQLTSRHSQICQFYNYFTDSGSSYLVQEWIQGITLEKKLRSRQKLSESETRNIILNLLPVLECIHNLGIVHCDINPSNIILRSKDNLPVLIDFGVAREVGNCPTSPSEELYKQTSRVGTTEYIPPEQLMGQATYNKDLYSLGLTTIHLLTGRSPQAGEITASLNEGAMSAPIPKPVNYGEAVSLVRKGDLEKPVRCGEALSLRRCPPLRKVLNPKGGFQGRGTGNKFQCLSRRFRCRNWRGFPHERLPKGFSDLSARDAPSSWESTTLPPLEAVERSAIKPSEFRGSNFALDSPDNFWYREKTAFNPNLVAVIDRAIATNPSYRFTSAQEMRLTLQSSKKKLSLTQAKTKRSAANKSQRKLWALYLIMCAEIAAVWLGRRYLIPIPDYQPPLDFSDLPQAESFVPLPVDDFTESTILETTNDALQAVIFSPGISQNKILQALGEPVWRKPGFWANSITWFYKDAVSEGIDIGYIFDRHTNKLRQAEIAVPSSTNLSTIKSALKSFLEEEAFTKTIEQGLQAVYQRQKATHNFTVGNLEGIIQRNHQDRIYIGVWQADFH